ncbi:hypothetical protein HY484_01625, partial [Candidatus Woesearchaeota archaeon]|nr:hypothetical protein [Candidatus Woesearchaeota archaeon]
GYAARDWSAEKIFGWVIGYEPKMQCLGAEILYWDATNERLHSTPTYGVVGNKADIRKNVGHAVNQALDMRGKDVEASKEQKDLLEEILRDMQPFQERLSTSPVYSAMQNVVDAIKAGVQVDVNNLPDSLALGYWVDEQPDKDWKCGCGAVHGKGVPGRLQVYDVAKVIRSTTSVEDIINVLDEANIFAYPERGVVVVPRKCQPGNADIVVPHRSSLLVLPYSLSLINYERGIVLHEDVDFYNHSMNAFVSHEEFSTYGLPKDCKIIPRAIAQEYLKSTAVLHKFWHYIGDVSEEVFKEANDSWDSRKEAKRQREVQQKREKLSEISDVVRELLCQPEADELSVQSGMNVAFAYAYPRGGIAVKLGKVTDVRDGMFESKRIFDAKNDCYRVDLDLGLKIMWANKETLPNAIYRERQSEVSCEYDAGTLEFTWEGSLGVVRFGNPSDSIEEQADESATVMTVQGRTPYGEPFAKTVFSKKILNGPKGKFKLPTLVTFNDDVFARIKTTIENAE